MATFRTAPSIITSIAVGNFKSIGSPAKLGIRPLTILAGANSSGKSSFMQPLLLLKQTLESQGDPDGALLLDGSNARFTSSDQILHKKLGMKSEQEFTVRLEADDTSIELHFSREAGKGFDVSRMLFSDRDGEIELRQNMTHAEIQKALPAQLKTAFRVNIPIPSKDGVQKKRELRVLRNRCFLDFGLGYFNQAPLFGMPYGMGMSRRFSRALLSLIHLPGLRGNPERTYPKVATGPSFPGRFEQYAASVVADWQDKKDDRLAILGQMLAQMGLTWKVTAVKVAETQYELKVGRLLHGKVGGARDMVSIADVGFGVSQTLPVLVALLVAQEGQLVYLEQPEIHLHPKAQRNMAYVFQQAIRRGATTIVETHSAILLREIQTLVAKGELSPKDVVLHWFSRSEDGTTTVQSAELDKNGSFGTWPVDFDETDMESEDAYLNAVEERRAGHAE